MSNAELDDLIAREGEIGSLGAHIVQLKAALKARNEEIESLKRMIEVTEAACELHDNALSVAESLRADLERERKDAERYRWLREHFFAADFEYRVDDNTELPMLVFGWPPNVGISGELNDCIDAALKEQP